MASNVNDTGVRGDDTHFPNKDAFNSHEKIRSTSETPVPHHDPPVREADSDKEMKGSSLDKGDKEYREKEMDVEPTSFSIEEEELEKPSTARRIYLMLKPFFFPAFWVLMTGYVTHLSLSISPRMTRSATDG